jgi:phospholipase D1/2
MADRKGYRMDFIRFYHLRAYDRLNAPYGKCYTSRSVCCTNITPPSETYLREVEKQSGVTFYEAQVAQAREWIGNGWQDGSTRELKIFEVKGNIGGGLQLEGDAKQNDAKVKTLPLPRDRQEAKKIVDRFEDAAKDVLGSFRVSDNVCHHAMKSAGDLSGEQWFGTEDEERNWCVEPFLR